MMPGDVVYFWMGGDEDIRGLYGWGILTSGAYMKKNWDSYGVDAEIKKRFKTPILARELKRSSTRRDLPISKQPQASNFLVESAQAKELARAIERFNEIPPER